MTAKDQLKVCNQGFVIVRVDETRMLIKAKANPGKMHSYEVALFKATGLNVDVLVPDQWRTFLKGFSSKGAIRRKMDKLLELYNVIED